MNKYKTKVPANFAAETRFEIRPVRAMRENEFERLKNKLLDEQLREAEAELNAPLRRAANEAAALAWANVFPLLTFPMLFEEKIATAKLRARRQARIFENSRELVGA